MELTEHVDTENFQEGFWVSRLNFKEKLQNQGRNSRNHVIDAL